MAQEGRRMGLEGSQVRTRFIDAAEDVLREEGHMAISARHVAARAGLKTQLLYYYFRTMDDLLLAVVRRINERRMERFEVAVAGPHPLRAMWEAMRDPNSASLAAEFTSIATHREAVRAEIVDSAAKFRALQVRTATALMPQTDSTGEPFPAAGAVMIAAALARMIVNEESLGLTEGHAEALKIVDRLLAYIARDKAATAG